MIIFFIKLRIIFKFNKEKKINNLCVLKLEYMFLDLLNLLILKLPASYEKLLRYCRFIFNPNNCIKFLIHITEI